MGDDITVKVGDFGLAKLFPHDGKDQQTSTYVGTPGYAPPEILRKEMYSFNVDVWTLGVCVYIILCGCPPFPQDMRPSTQQKIQHADRELRFPASHFSHASDEAKDFMRACMNPDPKTRMEVGGCLAHPWLANCTLPDESVGERT